MDAHQFDSMISSLTAPPTRRGILLRLGVGLLAALPLANSHDDVAAKKRKKHKKRKKKGGPTNPGATCSDGARNGSETDVDCGGPDCPPCGNGRICESNSDCSTARCGDGRGNGNICQSCENDGGICGDDENGLCECDLESGICFTDKFPNPNDFEDECPVCPAGTACRTFLAGSACVPLCGG